MTPRAPDVLDLRALRREVLHVLRQIDVENLDDDDLIAIGETLCLIGGDLRDFLGRVQRTVVRRWRHLPAGKHLVEGADGAQCRIMVANPKYRVQPKADVDAIRQAVGPAVFTNLFETTFKVRPAASFGQTFGALHPKYQGMVSAVLHTIHPPTLVSFPLSKHRKRKT